MTAARYYGVPADVAALEDEHETLWPLDVVVWREINRYRGEQTLRLVRRSDLAELANRTVFGTGDEPTEEAGIGSLLEMLGNDEEKDEEAEAQAAAMEQLAALDDESDSDDENVQRKEVRTHAPTHASTHAHPL